MHHINLIVKKCFVRITFSLFLAGGVIAEACISLPVEIPVLPKASYEPEKPSLFTHKFGVTLMLGKSEFFYHHKKKQWCIGTANNSEITCYLDSSKFTLESDDLKDKEGKKKKLGVAKVKGNVVTIWSINESSGEADPRKPYFTATATQIVHNNPMSSPDGSQYIPNFSKLTIENYSTEKQLDNILEYTGHRSKFSSDGEFLSMEPKTRALGEVSLTDPTEGKGRTGKRFSIGAGCEAKYKIDNIYSSGEVGNGTTGAAGR